MSIEVVTEHTVLSKISARNSAHLEYYRIDEQSDSNRNGNDIGRLSYLQPVDQHLSFSVGDIRVTRDVFSFAEMCAFD